jgi:peptidylprolyl isomerase
MKIVSTLLLFAAVPLSAQTAPSVPPVKKPATPATTTASATPARKPVTASACTKLPEISVKVPALPASMPCAKALYTITTNPPVRLENVSPLEGPDLREQLGIESSSFTLAYVDTKIGTGAPATLHKFLSINYTGYLVDGTQFDSSVGKDPITIGYGEHQVIPGWDTGLAGMKVGGKRRLFIPYQLAYGAQAHGPIPPKSELIFDVELVKQSDTDPRPKPPTPPAPPAGANSTPRMPTAPGAPARPPSAPPVTVAPMPGASTPSAAPPAQTPPPAPAAPAPAPSAPATPPAAPPQ